MKIFNIEVLPASFGASHNRNANATIKILKLNSFSHTFSSNFLSFDSVCSFFFCCFYFIWQTEKYVALHLVVYSEDCIESCSVKQLLGKI